MDKISYLNECRIIESNCTYSAEAHHRTAAREKRAGILFKVVPALVAAITSAMVLLKVFPSVSSVFAIISATIAAIGNIIDPDKSYQTNLMAAKSFTLIKHDARFLRESESTNMSDDGFIESVKNLHNRYNDIVRNVPPTNQKDFDNARKVIKAGIHDPD